MLNCMKVDQELQQQRRVDRIITRQLKEEKRQRKRVKYQMTMLVLGQSGSGKSTLIKLLKIILHRAELDRIRHERGRLTEEMNEEPFSEKEKKEYATLARQNILLAIKELVLAMTKLSIPYENPSNKELWQQFADIDPFTMTKLSSDCSSLIKQLWSDKGVCKECYDRRKEFNLPESAKYFLDSLDRITSSQYSPTIEDILRVHNLSTNAVELNALTNNLVEIRSQSLERPNKWIHLFNGVYIIYFIVDVSEYDLPVLLSSEAITNHLEASKLLFQTLCQTYVCHTTITLCFTKKDIFDEKIFYSHLVDYFPEYTGPKHDPEAAMAFICDMFMKVAQSELRQPQISIAHMTLCTVDVDSIQKVFSCLKTSILEYHLQQILKL